MAKIVFIYLFISGSFAFAGKIEKGFQALREFDYFKAKSIFEGTITKQESPSSYGLAIIYYRNDNPFHSLDSAYTFVQRAEKNYGNLTEKKKVQYKSFGFDYSTILDLRSQISSAFFVLANKDNTVDSYTNFMNLNPWANELFLATSKRDSIAYENAKSINTSSAYQYFLSTYPASDLFSKVQADLYRTQYLETTIGHNLISYLEFIAKFPDNPFNNEAEDRIYELTTESNTIQSFYTFIQAYPENRNVVNAWRNVYQLYLVDYSDERINQFIVDYPNYPFKEELEADILFMKLNLIPFKSEQYFGFMDYSGTLIIPAEYEQLGFFKEGLAFAMKNGLYGFINKANEVIIPFQYNSVSDFEQGRAVVEKDEKFGMIDRVGSLIFPLEFNELGTLSEGLVYGSKDSLYAYYDKNYNLRIQPKYNEAFAFLGKKAKVQIGINQAFIDEYGTFLVPPGYEKIRIFNDSLFIFEDEDSIGLIRNNCQVVVSAHFNEIGQLSMDRALAVQDDLIGYIDGTGKVVINIIYETFPNFLKRGQFKSNLAIVKQKGKFGVIDKQGKVILPISFNEIGDISSLMAFSKGKGWGFIDLTGKVIIQPEFDYAESFKDGLAIVEKMTLQGVIDAKGNDIIPISFASIERLTKDLFIVSNGSKDGIYSSKGEILVPLNYQQVRMIDKDLFLLTSNNEVHYLYLPEKRIIQPKITGE